MKRAAMPSDNFSGDGLVRSEARVLERARTQLTCRYPDSKSRNPASTVLT